MGDPALEAAVWQRLQQVIDPETNTDVVRMHLVEDLVVDKHGRVQYTFCPSSFVCPLAVTLLLEIKQAIAAVPGVISQEITVAGYLAATELQNLINQET